MQNLTFGNSSLDRINEHNGYGFVAMVADMRHYALALSATEVKAAAESGTKKKVCSGPRLGLGEPYILK